MHEKYGFEKPTVIADSGLLSERNIKELKEAGYSFIIGARIKNVSDKLTKGILQLAQCLKDGESGELQSDYGERLIINYSQNRAKRDYYNRTKGIARLEKDFKTGKITKSSINSRGYNKLLKLEGKDEIKVSIDIAKIKEAEQWDGLKGYITNSTLPCQDILDNYNQLWNIEKAFRISKTDLRVRPIYHRKQKRIEAHICIAFVAYAIFKELERRLAIDEKITVSAYKAIEMTKTIFRLHFTNAKTKQKINCFADLTDDQEKLLTAFGINCE